MNEDERDAHYETCIALIQKIEPLVEQEPFEVVFDITAALFGTALAKWHGPRRASVHKLRREFMRLHNARVHDAVRHAEATIYGNGRRRRGSSRR